LSPDSLNSEPKYFRERPLNLWGGGGTEKNSNNLIVLRKEKVIALWKYISQHPSTPSPQKVKWFGPYR